MTKKLSEVIAESDELDDGSYFGYGTGLFKPPPRVPLSRRARAQQKRQTNRKLGLCSCGKAPKAGRKICERCSEASRRCYRRKVRK